MEARRTRVRYGEEFKKDAVKLVIEGGRSPKDVAEGLGIHVNILYRWVRQYKKDPGNAFPGNGKLKPEDEELRQLRKQLRDVAEERDILKKAVSIFSKI
jgi:transposase